MQHGILGAPPSAAQVGNRLRGVYNSRALTNAFALPGGTRASPTLLTDIQAMAASVYITVKLHVTAARVLPHITSTLGCLCSTAGERAARTASTSRRSSHSTATWLGSGKPYNFGVG